MRPTAQIASLVGKLGLGSVAFLEHLSRVWEGYCSQLLLTRQVFLYLDRTYVVANGDARSLFDVGLQLFAAHLQAHPEVGGSSGAGWYSLVLDGAGIELALACTAAAPGQMPPRHSAWLAAGGAQGDRGAAGADQGGAEWGAG